MSIVVLCFELLGRFALCLRCLNLFYKLFCVVVDSVVIVSGCLLCFHCFSARWVVVVVGGCSLFPLFQALSGYFRMSRIFELFNIVYVVQLVSSVVSHCLGCLSCFQVVHVVQFVLDSRRLSRLVHVVFGCCLVA